ncbi:nucleotide sugar dehydrogenase [Oscillatoria sp. FACHB-1406]|uniref:nucleotide sugar dehydrogenase n=1 Tax=Oscillatoria sp. FACHB-1406 TaxID=2692846 RepID=UPI001683749A|nr:nucleotide sugar dehydrogenase [Oscillatoria sp. FACHB-1406]MBD2577194.1 nucleotide sugar dehydrogenase [Oscillatoria sp. FACHB-1406]
MSDRITVIGLGYVGLPVALALAEKFPNTIGFDINPDRIQELKAGRDRTKEVTPQALQQTSLQFTADIEDLSATNFFIVAVPTPIDRNSRPDLSPLLKASELVAKVLQPGSVVVYESTVYPGVTEEICGPALARTSGLKQGIDFKLGYSPERINPGDKAHTLAKIVKVVSGEDAETLERVASVYEAIIEAGVYRAPSIKVAEMAKVIENTQRDLNIAFMNELALICDRLDIRTHDVLQAAQTKWNFLPFTPGLVGGHCIGVDPYYLTTKAEELGYNPQVILAGRRINDSMGNYIAQRLVKLLVKANLPIKNARIGILGLTFKENVPDLRNSRIPDIVQELQQFGINPLIHDPLANHKEAQREYGIQLAVWSELSNLDGMIFAVNHQYYLELPLAELLKKLRPSSVLIDVKSALDPNSLFPNIYYWSL